MNPIASPVTAFDDVIIGEGENRIMSINGPNEMLDPDDFIVGEETDSKELESNTLLNGPSSELSNDIPGDESLDFQSINDLINSELKQPYRETKTLPTPKPKTIELTPEEVVQVEPIYDLEEELGEDFQAIQGALQVYEKIRQDMENLAQVDHIRQDDRAVVIEMIHHNQKIIRKHHDHLQGLVSNYIQRGEFDRIASIDQVKRKLDEVMLQMRAIENRITNKGVKLTTGSYIDGTFAEDIYNEAEGKTPRLDRKTNRRIPSKVRGKKSARNYTTSNGLSKGLKLIMVLCLFALMPISYHLSSNYGKTPTQKIDVQVYTSVLPLIHGRGIQKTFHGIVADSFQDLEKAKREQIIRQFGAMVKVDGYETIFLSYETKGIAAIYNLPKNNLRLR